jgi:choline-sulfatase
MYYMMTHEDQEWRDDALVFRLADHGEMGMSHGGMRQKAFVLMKRH